MDEQLDRGRGFGHAIVWLMQPDGVRGRSGFIVSLSLVLHDQCAALSHVIEEPLRLPTYFAAHVVRVGADDNGVEGLQVGMRKVLVAEPARSSPKRASAAGIPSSMPRT